MRFIVDYPGRIAVPNLQSNEKILQVAFSPKGHVFCVLTSDQLQFWAGLQHWTFLVSITLIPSVKEVPVSSLGGNKKDEAISMVWHSEGRMLAVSTMERRIIYVEADIILTNESAISLCPNGSQQSIAIANASHRVCIAGEATLDNGIITGLFSSPQVLFATTSAGFVVALRWTPPTSANSSVLLQYFNAGYFLQNVAVYPSTAVVGGSLIDFSYCSKIQKAGAVLADGTVCLVKFSTSELLSGSRKTNAVVSSPSYSSTGTDPKTPTTFSSEGICLAGIGAEKVVFNVKHNLMAISCSNADIRVYSLEGDEDNAQARPRLLYNTNSLQWYDDDTTALGEISTLQWSRDENTLAIAFTYRGFAVFDVTGVCLGTSFSRYGSRGVQNALPSDCQSVAWDHEGFSLAAICSNSLMYFNFASIASMTGDQFIDGKSSGASATVIAESDRISFLHTTDSESVLDNWETCVLPKEYITENFPLRLCSVSSDGVLVACAGQEGVALYSRKLRKWRVFGVKSEEKNISCVLPPVWFSSLCVVLPIRHKTKQQYQLIFYPRFHLDGTSLLETIPLQHKPLYVTCSCQTLHSNQWTLLLHDTSTNFHFYEVVVQVDSIQAPKKVQLTVTPQLTLMLPPAFHHPLKVVILPIAKRLGLHQHRHSSTSTAPSFDASSNAPRLTEYPQLIVLRRDHRLSLYDLALNNFEDLQQDAYQFWLDVCSVNTSACRQTVAMVVSNTLRGSYVDTIPHIGGGMGQQSSPTTTPTLTPSRHASQTQLHLARRPASLRSSNQLAEFDVEALPIAIVPEEGFLIYAMEGIFRRYFIPNTFPLFQVHIKPTLYRHHLLLSLFIAQQMHIAPGGNSFWFEEHRFSEELIQCVVQQLRENGTFVESMDYLIHLVVEEESVHFHGFDFHGLSSALSSHSSKVVEEKSTFTPPKKDGFSPGKRSPSPPGEQSQSALETMERRKPRQQQYDKRKVLQGITAFLRKYSEYYEILVGCIRKTDIRHWRVLFDVIGPPQDIFSACVENSMLTEAAHMVRVVMMSKPKDTRASLEAASQSARSLFKMVLCGKDFQTAYELLRFLALIELEIELPGLEVPETPASAIERALRSMFQMKNSIVPSVSTSVKVPERRDSICGQLTGCLRPNKGQSAEVGGTSVNSSAALHQVLIKYPELHEAVSQESTFMLLRGQISQLCSLFNNLDLDLSHFINSTWPKLKGDPHSAGWASSTTAMQLFVMLHVEFNLPRCYHSITINTNHDMEKREGDTTACTTLPNNSLKLWTPTQEYLIHSPDAWNALESLLELFQFLCCDEYTVALSILLIRPHILKEVLAQAPALVPQVVKMACDPASHGYERLFSSVLKDVAVNL